MFGLSFYTVPKITPLGYVSCFYGSWATAAAHALLAFCVRRPPRLAESVLGMCYCAPAIWVFTTIAYYAEYNSRERFVLRRRLRSESITLAVACTPSTSMFVSGHRAFGAGRATSGAATAASVELTLADRLVRALSLSSFNTGWISNHRTASYLVALGLWAAFTLGGWTSLPDVLKFVDQDTGWAWFSHCAGVTVFLLVMTRRLLWLMIVPLCGAFILWMLTLTMPASWIIISAHSVGYGLLLASVVIAMGVFSWFMCAWNELVAFLTRTCFLFPQLQAGMETDFPLLVKIVSEYTANFDPLILSSRRASPPVTVAVPVGDTKLNASPESKRKLKSVDTNTPAQKLDSCGPPSSNSRRRRTSTAVHESKASQRDEVESVAHSKKSSASSVPRKPLTSEKCDHGHHREGNPSGNDSTSESAPLLVDPSSLPLKTDHLTASHDERIVSVLPSFSPGKCFFCSKNDAEHYVPACGMWGKWTYWRMSQQHPGLPSSSLSILPSAASTVPSNKNAVAMCTSYYDLQHRNAELEARVDALDSENRTLAQQQKTRAQEFERELARIQQELHALQEKHAQEKLRLEVQHRDKLADVLRESNRAAREHKMEVKKIEAAGALALTESQKQARRDLEAAKLQAREAQENARELEIARAALKEAKQQVADMVEAERHRQQRRRAVSDSSEARSCDGDATTSTSASKMRLQRSPLALDASFTSATSNEFDDDYDCDTSSSPEARQSPVAVNSGLVTLQPTGRLPYAKSLEIEGLRESAVESKRDVDYAARWRNWQQGPIKS